jgi:hypothetical protein
VEGLTSRVHGARFLVAGKKRLGGKEGKEREMFLCREKCGEIFK